MNLTPSSLPFISKDCDQRNLFSPVDNKRNNMMRKMLHNDSSIKKKQYNLSTIIG